MGGKWAWNPPIKRAIDQLCKPLKKLQNKLSYLRSLLNEHSYKEKKRKERVQTSASATWKEVYIYIRCNYLSFLQFASITLQVSNLYKYTYIHWGVCMYMEKH